MSGVPFGAEVTVGPRYGVTVAHRSGRRAILKLADGREFYSVLVETWRAGDFRSIWRGRDHRVTPALAASGPHGQRDWLGVAKGVKEEPIPNFAFATRSTNWCVQWLVRAGGPTLHHENWRARKRLTGSDFGVQEHQSLAMILEDLAGQDCLDVTNLVGAERLVRKMQMIEYFWEDKQREKESEHSRLPPEEVAAFMGGSGLSSRPASMICPAVLDYISKELERVSNIKKNARKLREETRAGGKEPANPKK